MLAGDAAHVLSSVPRVLMSSQSIVRGQHGDGPGRVPTSTPSDATARLAQGASQTRTGTPCPRDIAHSVVLCFICALIDR